MSKRSAVWKYFEKNNDGTSTCVLCYKKLKTSGNTTNLNGHLNSMHKSIINQKTHDSNKQDVADDPGEAINTSVPNTDNVITLPPPYQNFKRQTNIKQSFNNISTYTEGGVKDSKITNLIVYMISKYNQPISIVEDKDIWTDIQTRSYLGITVHFANTSTFTLKSGILGVYDLSERHTSDYIAVKLKEACFEWEIPMKSVTAVITDGAANMTKSIELAFGRNHQIPCFAHTINLIAERSLSNVAELTKLISNVKSIVTWFKHSVVGSDDLRKLTGGDGKLIQEVSTRWNSTFYMLQRFISLRPFVNEILNKNIKAPEMISAQSVLDITEVIEATRELCVEFYVTSSIYFKSSIALSRALSIISDTLKTSTDQVESIPEPDLTDQEQNTSDGFSLWDNHNGLMQQTNQECIETEIGYPSELCLYLKSNLANLSEKPLEVWHNMSTVYPNLSKLAIKYLSIVDTSVPSERLFSKAGSTLSTKRNRITCK
eukprot:XP_016659883.1 PREDICTED: zinc finger BED domain-containing protein 4-like [Acyrthosiphon pisum]